MWIKICSLDLLAILSKVSRKALGRLDRIRWRLHAMSNQDGEGGTRTKIPVKNRCECASGTTRFKDKMEGGTNVATWVVIRTSTTALSSCDKLIWIKEANWWVVMASNYIWISFDLNLYKFHLLYRVCRLMVGSGLWAWLVSWWGQKWTVQGASKTVDQCLFKQSFEAKLRWSDVQHKILFMPQQASHEISEAN